MINTIIGPIVGGFIAGVVGISIVFLQNYLRKKKEQALIVNELLVEIEANLKICHDPASSKMWWMVKFKTEVYNSYKGRIEFLSEDIRGKLREIVHTIEGVNTEIEAQRLRHGFGVAEPQEFRPVKHPEYLKQWLIYCRDELQKWQKKHQSKINRGVRWVKKKLKI